MARNSISELRGLLGKSRGGIQAPRGSGKSIKATSLKLPGRGGVVGDDLRKRMSKSITDGIKAGIERRRQAAQTQAMQRHPPTTSEVPPMLARPPAQFTGVSDQMNALRPQSLGQVGAQMNAQMDAQYPQQGSRLAPPAQPGIGTGAPPTMNPNLRPAMNELPAPSLMAPAPAGSIGPGGPPMQMPQAPGIRPDMAFAERQPMGPFGMPDPSQALPMDWDSAVANTPPPSYVEPLDPRHQMQLQGAGPAAGQFDPNIFTGMPGTRGL